MTVSADDCRKAVANSGKTWWLSHHCHFCTVPVGWVFEKGTVRYRSACDCKFAPDKPMTWEDVADAINMQSDPEIAEKMFKELSEP